MSHNPSHHAACLAFGAQVYDFVYDRDRGKWVPWMDTIESKKISPEAEYSNIIVSTVCVHDGSSTFALLPHDCFPICNTAMHSSPPACLFKTEELQELCVFLWSHAAIMHLPLFHCHRGKLQGPSSAPFYTHIMKA